MSNKRKPNLTRRNVLAGLGTIGVASAGAGLGTSAFFNDTESFEGNSLAAGELDLKLDYRVTYHGGPGRLEEIKAMGYPDAEEVPDEEGVYVLDEVPTNGDIPEDWGEFVVGEDFCHEDWDDVLVNGDEVRPIHLADVKPGDSGCLTTSLHLCDNPGYVWMNGELTENAENGVTDPESAVDDDADQADPQAGDEWSGELADSIETRLWYDENCDCVVNTGEGDGGDEVDVVLVLDTSGSMSSSDVTSMGQAAEDLIDELGGNAQVGLVTYSSSPQLDHELTGEANFDDVKAALPSGSGGGTNMEGGVVMAAEELENGTNARDDARKIMVVMSDGNANQNYSRSDADADGIGSWYDADSNSDPTEEAEYVRGVPADSDFDIELFTVAYGSADQSTLMAMASEPTDAHFFPAAEEEDLIDAFGQIGQIISGERVIFEGTLAELMGVLATDDGIPLDGDRGTAYDEVVEDGNGDDVPANGDHEGREPFDPSQTNCIGLEWELPPEVDNVVQSDSVSFDLGFYAEQARHNDGSGTETAQA